MAETAQAQAQAQAQAPEVGKWKTPRSMGAGCWLDLLFGFNGFLERCGVRRSELG